MQDGIQNVNAQVEQKAAELAAAAKEEGAGAGEGQKKDEGTAGDQKKDEGAGAGEGQKKDEGTAGDQKKDEGAGQKKDEGPTPDELLKQQKDKIEELERLLAEKNDKKDKSPEQIKKEEDIYQAKLKAYAVENELMKSEDLQRYDTVKAAADEALVFDAFAAEVKDQILEELGDDPSEDEIIAAIRKEFESEYPLNSKSEKVRARAEAKLKKVAGEIRNPLESSFNTAKARFDDEQYVRAEYPKYQAAMKKLTTGVVPDKMSFFKEVDGEDDIDIQVPVSEKDKKEILESLEAIVKDPENFLLHKNGKTEEVQTKIKTELEYQLWKRLGEEGKKALMARTMEIGKSRGLTKGSDTGAKNSFATNQGGAGAATAGNSGLTAQQQVIESTRIKK